MTALCQIFIVFLRIYFGVGDVGRSKNFCKTLRKMVFIRIIEA